MKGVVAAASTEIMQLFHARAPVIGCTFAAEAANTGSRSRDITTLPRANFSVTKLMATSDENYPFFPSSPSIRKLDNTPCRRSASRHDPPMLGISHELATPTS